jgi:hypothetical protein
MKIANPMYDVAFNFMMEDDEVAKTFLSAIIQEEVVELDFAPQERTFRVPPRKKGKQQEKSKRSGIIYTVCWFDFLARIVTSGGGYKTVLIELQKAKLASDIMRFRRRASIQYQNSANVYDGGKDRKTRRICIFLLGCDIGVPDCPIIQVDSRARGVAMSEEVKISSNEFIRSLHHRSWIVQTNLLNPHRNDLEKLLSIFDQASRSMHYPYIRVNEEDFPEKYRSIIRRLHTAAEDEDTQIQMEMEDDYIEELRDKEREIAEKEKAIVENNKIIRERKKAIEAKAKEIEAKDREIAAKDKEIEAKDKAIAIAAKAKAIEANDKEIEELKKQISEIQRQRAKM